MRFFPIATLAIIIAGCNAPEQENAAALFPRDTLIPEKLDWNKPTEMFKGEVRGNEVVFAHSKYQAYRLTNKSGVSYGKMNTERGYGDDPDATVYVLNSDKAEKDQKYFARMSSGSVYLLDNDRAVVDDAYFTAIVGAMSPVTAEKKPAVRTKSTARKKSIISKRKKRTKYATRKRRQSKSTFRKRTAAKSQPATSPDSSK